MTDAPTLSLSKDKIRVLMLEGVNDSAIARFEQVGYSNLERLPKALDGQALIDAVKGVHILGIRSRTQITPEVLAAADRLIAVGCFRPSGASTFSAFAPGRSLPTRPSPAPIAWSPSGVLASEPTRSIWMRRVNAAFRSSMRRSPTPAASRSW